MPHLFPAPRHVWVLRPHEPLCCPYDHRFDKHAWSIGDAPARGERCTKRRDGHECGACLFWWLLPGGARLVASVSSRELHDMERDQMDVWSALAYLGLRRTAA